MNDICAFSGSCCNHNWAAIAEGPAKEYKPKTPIEQSIEHTLESLNHQGAFSFFWIPRELKLLFNR